MALLARLRGERTVDPLERLRARVPGGRLAPGARAEHLGQVEEAIGFLLPAGVRDLYLAHDGEQPGSTGLLLGYAMLPLAAALRAWCQLQEEEAAGRDRIAGVSFTPGAVQEPYQRPGWFPIAEDGGGNFLGIDLDPGPTGTVGQVIDFGRDQDVHHVWAPSLPQFIDLLIELLQRRRAVVRRHEGWSYPGNAGSEMPYAVVHPPQSDPEQAREWYRSLDPALREELGRPEDAVEMLRTVRVHLRRDSVPAGTDLRPLAQMANLRSLLLHAPVIASLEDLPDLPRLVDLVAVTSSLEGVDRYPGLLELVAIPPEGTSAVTPADLSTLHSLRRLRTTLAAATDLELLAAPGLQDLSAVVSTIDDLPDAAWERLSGLTSLTLEGLKADDLDFLLELTALESLTVHDLTGTDIRALAQLRALTRLEISGAGLKGVDALLDAPALSEVIADSPVRSVLQTARPDIDWSSRIVTEEDTDDADE